MGRLERDKIREITKNNDLEIYYDLERIPALLMFENGDNYSL
jgi:hypothetical protein